MGRNVSVIRLKSGKLIIHSTAPFSEADLSALRQWGTPTWLVEATNFHDTLARQGAAALPDLPYLVPPGFPLAAKLNGQPLDPPPAEWADEVKIIPIDGMPKINEFAMFHPESKTLIVADLLFNIPESAGAFTLAFLQLISGIKTYPGNSRMFRSMIKDRDAFEGSLKDILELDFDRIIVGHGEPIEADAKETLRKIFHELGFAV